MNPLCENCGRPMRDTHHCPAPRAAASQPAPAEGLGPQQKPLSEAFSGFEMLRERFAPAEVQPGREGERAVLAARAEVFDVLDMNVRTAKASPYWSDVEREAVEFLVRNVREHFDHPVQAKLDAALSAPLSADDAPKPQSEEGVIVLQLARGPVEVDTSIAPIVAALNAAGAETAASCSGHGFRPGNIALRDGREIIIARNFTEGRRIDRLFPIGADGEPIECSADDAGLCEALDALAVEHGNRIGCRDDETTEWVAARRIEALSRTASKEV